MAKQYQHHNILSWAEEDRPREKLLLKGKEALTDAEILAVLLRSGTGATNAVDLSKAILRDVNHDLNKLARKSVEELMRFKGIGKAKAMSIVCALELGRRRKEKPGDQIPRIRSSSDAYVHMKPYLMDKRREEFWVIILNRSNSVVKTHNVSTGGVSGTVADPKIIFKAALDELGSSLILVHNHPSGNLQPSETDLKLTKKLVQAGQTLEIPVLDHIIFSDNGYMSFADEALL
jgi:DNA repair protein RadC